MHLLHGIASNFIGLLLLALSSGGSVAISATPGLTATSTTATSTTLVITDHSVIESLRNTLLHMQENLNAKEGSKDTHKEESGDDRNASSTIDRSSGSERTSAEHESIRPGSRDEDSAHEDEDEQDDDRESEHGKKSGTATGGVRSTPSVPPIVTPVSVPVSSGITMATVAQHNTKTSCYTAINGSVYDVTLWISQHPGGASAITSLCGKDGSAAFSSQHGGQARPASELAAFKIGVLAN